MKIKTLKAFSGPDGRHAKDVTIDVSPDRADWLVENGFAERTVKLAQTIAKKAAPSPARKPASVATQAQPTE